MLQEPSDGQQSTSNSELVSLFLSGTYRIRHGFNHSARVQFSTMINMVKRLNIRQNCLVERGLLSDWVYAQKTTNNMAKETM